METVVFYLCVSWVARLADGSHSVIVFYGESIDALNTHTLTHIYLTEATVLDLLLAVSEKRLTFHQSTI